MNKTSLFGLASVILMIQSCASSEIGESKDVNQAKIYQDFSVDYVAGKQYADVSCTFRFAGDKGTTLVLSSPSSVSFDGHTLSVDSTTFSGAFYSYSAEQQTFPGAHEFIFTDYAGKAYKNKYTYYPLAIKAYPAKAPKDQPIKVYFETAKLGPDDYVELGTLGSDSSFSITYEAADTGNVLVIPVNELKRQKKSSLRLMPRMYRRQPLSSVTDEGGVVVTSTSLDPIQIELQ